MQARHRVQRIRRTQTGENALGQPIYADSVTSVAVYGWQPSSEMERHTAALAGRTVSDLKLLSPTGDFKSSDAVVINGVTYEVDGEVEDFTKGPFGFNPGFAVGLRRVG
ncbi:hypothetical protein [Mycolicibacter heraklionensis]|uniref:hypothetical protein n=1 Tax=Mycolicibacter heraklionensis TaxID=512402 RepID=UPI0007EADF67|nr:hypothetical protein [Mycolicibacter heraklionensis]OBG32419.1 hypothetical protein A5671_07765 [Mycolicibacter heraklionensis]